MPQAIVELWFDVESRYMTTMTKNYFTLGELWFDVESRYMTTT